MKTNVLFFRILLCITIFFWQKIAFAQKNYVNGYIVTTQNDTIRGFINDKNWEKSPKEILFKKTLQDNEPVQYTPVSIHSFYVQSSNEYYISYIGKIDATPIKADKMIEVTEINHFLQKDFTIVDTAFLTVIIRGTASLYSYKDKQEKIHYFLQKDQKLPEELGYQKFLLDQDNGGKQIQVLQKYKGQLNVAFKDCEKATKAIKLAEYTKNSLTKIVNQYNTCFSTSNTQFIQKTEKTKTEIGIIAGGVQTLYIQSYPSYYKNGTTYLHYNKSYDPTVGISFNFVLPRNHKSWSAYTEILWRSYSITADYSTSNAFDRHLKVGYIKGSAMVRYTMATRTIKPFFNAGISYSFITNAEGNIISNNEKDADSFEKAIFGLQGGGGIQWNRWGCELRYEHTKGVFQGLYNSGSENSLYLIFRYALN
ncbi:hypothetical protein [Xanthocytophaga agilis]|uniref:Outer membrane protein beta-barrel domain-containing protein n=1 Tax=Xanthocytophaga agilis TaxID=3048010 RepID=A0AAE3R797_9BACT|nr:hypothetical protein [Xanthocytophaga agilis]MDJ1502887.1 hypothetical protein [Xanthocytophaga agilis]